jgi:hypothetical protein
MKIVPLEDTSTCGQYGVFVSQFHFADIRENYMKITSLEDTPAPQSIISLTQL